MNKSSFVGLLFVAVGLLISCEQKEGIQISGTVENPVPDQPVILTQFGEGGLNPIDTVELQDGSFEFYVNPKEPSFYRLVIQNRRQVDVILNGDEKSVEVIVDAQDLQADPVVEGAPENKHLDYYNQLLSNMREDDQMINQQRIEARATGDVAEMDALAGEYNQLVAKYFEKVIEYSNEIKPSLAVFYGISSLRIEDHFGFYDSLAAFYADALPNHAFTKDLVARVGSMKKLSTGAVAPEISLPSPDGDIITLSSLKGNYVLIDFWAAWCGPCRRENPNVVRVYNEYKDKNFEILGVSLDRTRDAWVKAIEQDGLIWKHVSDLQYFRSQAAQDYQIDAIPATYLIDPDGKIIAKGLRGPSLEAKLKEIFG